MRKSITLFIAGVVLASLAVQAESLTMRGILFSENNGKYWRVGKISPYGIKIVEAIIPTEEADRVSLFDGKQVTVKGEKDPNWKGNIPKFSPGFTIEATE